MIIDHRTYKNIDFKKYKRVFAFGCSFTNYDWPTWANILMLEMPEAEKYNYGVCGAGNVYISNLVAFADQKHKFTKDDLILLMWTTHCREDRYKESRWITPGNIFTQNVIGQDFVKEWGCIKGYLVRDAGLMKLTKNYLQYAPCDTVMLKGVDPDYDFDLYTGNHTIEDVVDFYRDVFYDMPKPLHDYFKINNGKGWKNGHHYVREYTKGGIMGKVVRTLFADYHPNPEMYLHFLRETGFILSDETVAKTMAMNNELLLLDEHEKIEQWKEKLDTTIWSNYHTNMHII